MSEEAQLVRTIAAAFDTQSMRLRPSGIWAHVGEREVTPICFMRHATTDEPMVLAFCWKWEATYKFRIFGITQYELTQHRPVPSQVLCQQLFRHGASGGEHFGRHYVAPEEALRLWG